MKVKRYEGKNIQDVVSKIKVDLGPGATILYMKDITQIYLGFSEQYIRSNRNHKINQYKSVIELREDDSLHLADEYVKETKKLKQLCVEYNSSYFEITNDYIDEINNIISFVGQLLKKSGN